MIQQERLLKVLKAPHISEKATNNAEKVIQSYLKLH